MMMMEVTPGHLAGENPSERDAEDEFFDETIPAAADADAMADAVDPDAEHPVEGFSAGPQGPEVSDETAIAPGAPAAPEAERAQPAPSAARKNDPREYVVLEHHTDDSGDYLTEVARVVARNGVNAIRKAFREHVKDDDLHRFVTVPATQFKLIPVQHTKREVGSVSIGS